MPSYLVTGPSRENGIGLEFVRQLSADPSNIVFGVVRNKSKATGLLKLAESRQNVHAVEGDIADIASIKKAAEEVAKVTKGLDVLINNAALLDGDGKFETLANNPSQEAFNANLRTHFDVNTIGPINVINAFLPLISNGDLKKVVNISTGIADVEATIKMQFPIATGYTLSKAALNFVIAKYAADPELRKKGIKFLALSPGFVNTQDASAAQNFTEEDLKLFGFLTDTFKKYQPDWDGQPLTPEQSVTAQLKVIEKLDLETSGAFLSHHGDKNWL